MVVKTGMRFVKRLVLLMPISRDEIVKNTKASEEAKNESSNNELISSAFGVTAINR